VGVTIKVEDLTKSFGKQLIWGDVTLTVPAGEICVMLGPSGTGKSVFLKALIGLLKPDKGSIVIGSEPKAPSCLTRGPRGFMLLVFPRVPQGSWAFCPG
jgi:ABC-type transporter Mla maintaining outer membrane lipid asymmetry ATPase subunit MlaF